jgi:putative transposase
VAGIAAGDKRRPGQYGGKPAAAASNTLHRQFEVDAPDRVWGELCIAIGPRTLASDIIYIKTHEGWLYLAVVIDVRRENSPPDCFSILLHLSIP